MAGRKGEAAGRRAAARGRIVRTGGKELAHELEAQGYAQYQEEMAS